MRAPRQPGGWPKRIVDVAVSGGLLAITAPIQIVVAAAIRLSMGRPVLFRQTRPGLGARPFRIVKFRTMAEGSAPDADRLTPVGRLVRSTSLDELPQLWCVLKGDMSLVGPRPLLTAYVPRYDTRQARRHEVRPGITGLAQVSGRNSLSWPERLELDVQYVERVGVRTDLQILLKTLSTVVRRKGLSADGHVTMPEFRGDESPGQFSPDCP